MAQGPVVKYFIGWSWNYFRNSSFGSEPSFAGPPPAIYSCFCISRYSCTHSTASGSAGSWIVNWRFSNPLLESQLAP